MTASGSALADGSMSQPTPEVTKSDLDRIVRRDFPAEQVPVVEELMSKVEVREWPRVMLACLKLAAGNLDALRYHVADAPGYYRDIISEAEYPHYTKVMFRIERFSDEERQRIYDKDWAQYLSWFQR
jgi:hypothetical protein